MLFVYMMVWGCLKLIWTLAISTKGDRNLVKKLWLAAQYGQSLEKVEPAHKAIAKSMRSYLRSFYPFYWKNLNGLRRLGFVMRDRGFSMKLPHSEPACPLSG